MAAPDLLGGTQAVLLDLDGVVRHGRAAIPGAREAIVELERRGKRVGFLTNNSARGSQTVAAQLRALGIVCEPEQVMTAAEAAALLLLEAGPRLGRGVHVCGTPELEGLLDALQVPREDADHADTVLVGFDAQFGYPAIRDALEPLLRGAWFVACNRERNYPGDGGRILPGCGAMVGALEGASGRAVDVIVGKPERLCLDLLCASLGVPVSASVLVGDSWESDIVLAQRAGMRAVYVTPDAKADGGVVCVRSLAELVFGREG